MSTDVPTVKNVAIMSRVMAFVGDTVQKVGPMAHVCGDWRDAVVNYSNGMWKNIVKRDADGTTYSKLLRMDPLAYAVLAYHEQGRGGLDVNNPYPEAKDKIEPLADAALVNKPNVVRALIMCGADVNGKDNLGNQLIVVAAMSNNVETIRCFLEKNPELAKVQHHTFGKNYVIHFMCQSGNLEAVKLLVKKGADVACVGDNGLPPIVYAARHPAILKFLIEECKVDIDGCGKDGRSSLHDASMMGIDESVKYLLSKGANVNKVDAGGRTPLDITSRPSTVEIIKAAGAKTAKEVGGAAAASTK